MRPKTVVVNTGLALVLLAAAVGAVLQIDDPDAPETPEQTAAVIQGPVVSTVSTTGNLNAPRTVGLPFAGQQIGLVRTIDIEVGDTVTKGQKLASVDDRLARNQLKHAEASLENAEAQVRAGQAQLLAAREGQTAAEAELDRATVAQAIQQLGNAQLVVANAREKRREVLAEQRALVDSAAESLSRSRRQVTRTASRAQGADLPSPPGATTDRSERSITATSSSAAIDSARGALVQAEVQRNAALTDANQALRAAKHDATLAARALHVARSQARVNAQGGRASEIATARAAIAQARAQVSEALAQIADARVALANTILRSPYEGIIVDLAGGVGETPISAPRGTTSSSVVPAGPGSVENRRPATQSGFVIISDLTTKFVTAAVNEADVGKVKVGQPATVTFPATGSTVRGTVQELDPQETVVNNVVQYNVKVLLENTPEKLGQSAAVQIVTSDRQNVLSVPNAAIIRAGDQSLLQVRRDGKDMRVPVTPGLVGDQTTEVTSSLLRAGDLVILPGTGSGGGRPSVPSRGRGGGGL